MHKALSLLLALMMLLPRAALGESAPSALSIFQALQDEDYAAVYAQFDETMQKTMSLAVLATLLPQLEALGGTYTGYDREETAQQEGYTLTILHLLYEKSGFAFRVSWRDGKITGLFVRPEALPSPLDPAVLPEGLAEEAVSFGSPALPGTLTWPQDGPSPMPAVVLLHGSGPNDRDETVGQTKLFRDLAWGLAERGVAVLRYDKRTLVYGAEMTAEELAHFTIREESLKDAAAAARFLAADPRIDPRRIYLVGHSLGAMAAPRAAEENPGLFAGLTLLAGTPRTLADLIISQNQALIDALPALIRPAQQARLDALCREWGIILAGSGEEAIGKTAFGQPAYYLWEMAQQDTADTLAHLDLPVLIVNGGQDFQVSDENGIEAWQEVKLPENVEIRYYPELNHVLMAPNTPETLRYTAAEYEIPCLVDERIISDIAQFIYR